MSVPSTRHGLVLLVAVALLLSGCAGDTGTGEGTPTETQVDTPTETQVPTTVEQTRSEDDPRGETATPASPDTITVTTRTSVTPSETGTGDETATATATPSATQPSTPTASSTPPENGDASPFAGGSHPAALREAGSYTIQFTFEGLSGTSGGSSVSGTEKADLETGERYSAVTSESDGQEFSFEYYVPPDSDTAYRHVAGQTEEIPESQALLFNFTNPGTGESAGEWPHFREAGSGETTLGPATKYVVDSPEDLPESTTEEFDSIESVNFVVWIDDDTGVVAEYDYQLTYTEDGEENTIRMRFEVTDLGATTIEEPDWVP